MITSHISFLRKTHFQNRPTSHNELVRSLLESLNGLHHIFKKNISNIEILQFANKGEKLDLVEA